MSKVASQNRDGQGNDEETHTLAGSSHHLPRGGPRHRISIPNCRHRHNAPPKGVGDALKAVARLSEPLAYAVTLAAMCGEMGCVDGTAQMQQPMREQRTVI